MSVTLKVIEVVEVLGFSFPATINLSADGGTIKSLALPAAKAGTLTTRTSDSEGELTMGAGHGIITGDRLDLYWDGGSRRGITVGTVAGNAVPLTTLTGTGDVLPADETAITAMVPQEEEILFTGDNAKALAFYSQRRGTIVLTTAADAESTARVLTAGVSSTWTPERDATVPTAGDSVAKAFFSHADSVNTGIMRVAALFS